MKLAEKEKKNFVIVVIGNRNTGETGLKNSKSISLEDTTVKEVYNKIKKMIKNTK